MNSTTINRLSRFRANSDQLDRELDYERQTIARFQLKISQLEADKLLLVKAVGLIDRCIQVISANGISKIESIVTGGIRLVFNDPTLGLIVEKKEGTRGNSYTLQICHGNTIGDPMDSFGGGLCNVVSFLLRIILIKRFKLAKFVALDESLMNVGKQGGDLARVSEMLNKLCKDHGFTILAITHEPVLSSAADIIYQVSTENGVPTLRKINSPDIQQEMVKQGNLETKTKNNGRDSKELSRDDSSLSPPLVEKESSTLSQ